MQNARRLTAALGLLVLCSASAASAAEPQAAPGTRIEKDLLEKRPSRRTPITACRRRGRWRTSRSRE